MEAIRIGELKARLSEYLRAARSGDVFTVLDRDTPIATLGPYRPLFTTLEFRKASRRASDLSLPPRPAMATDTLARLVGDRQRR